MKDRPLQNTVQIIIDRKSILIVLGLVAALTTVAVSAYLTWKTFSPVPITDQLGETINLSNATKVISIKAMKIDTGEVVLTDQDGLTLYTNLNENEFVSTCYDECAEKWPPMTLNSGEEVAGPDFSVIVRKDGSLQAAYLGFPLYRYYKDQQEGDYLGDRVEGVWTAAKLQLVEETEPADHSIPDLTTNSDQQFEENNLPPIPTNEQPIQ